MKFITLTLIFLIFCPLSFLSQQTTSKFFKNQHLSEFYSIQTETNSKASEDKNEECFLKGVKNSTVGRLSSPYQKREEVIHKTKMDNQISMVVNGNVMLGVILSVNEQGNNSYCGQRLRDPGSVQFVEAAVYAVREMNRNHILPNNLTIGVVIVDDCIKPEIALQKALLFLPVKCSRNKRPTIQSMERYRGVTFFDVVGVVGPQGSPSNMLVAPLMGILGMPQISPLATSDLLSDKRKYPFFMRMSPPNSYQMKAIVNLLRHFNWTYVAVVFSVGGYGDSAVNVIKTLASDNHICIGATLPITPQTDHRKIVDRLLDINAVVVLLLTDQEETLQLFRIIKLRNLIGRFTFVGGDGVGMNLDDLDEVKDVAVGGLSVRAYSVTDLAFFDYYESLTPCSNNSNPWLKLMWKEALKKNYLSFSNYTLSFNTEHEAPLNCSVSIKLIPEYSRESLVSFVMDAILVFGNAISRLITDSCTNISPQYEDEIPNSYLQNCIRNNGLLSYLINTTIVANNGEVKFDKNGDIKGKYEILNFQKNKNSTKYTSVRVAIWHIVNESIDMDDSLILWNVKQNNGSFLHKKEDFNEVPHSSCGRKCESHEYYFYFKDTCCWECRRCAPNEISVLNATRCQPCPEFEWPNPEHFNVCLPIVPNSIEWTHPVVILTSALTALGILASLFILAIYCWNNTNRLVKATSRELSYFMWMGIISQYFLTYLVLSKPSKTVCYIRFLGFNISFSAVYAPLLVRTNRIYRLFRIEVESVLGPPPWTSPLSQIFISGSLVMIQVVINLVSLLCGKVKPEEHLWMPLSSSKKMVELKCLAPLEGLSVSLAYNIFLVILCSYYAFKTRSLPYNFNESRCIMLCVYTTFVIWIVFVPSYIITYIAFHQSIALAAALLLNASVALLCLYVPKIYAMYAPSIFPGANRQNFTAEKKCNSTQQYSTTCLPKIIESEHPYDNMKISNEPQK